jgi:hypothetical protein
MADEQNPFGRQPAADDNPFGKKTDYGQTHAAVEGALGGATANFRDELYALSEASGLPHWLGGLRAPVGAFRLATEEQPQPTLSDLITGAPTRGPVATQFDKSLADIRAKIRSAKENYPVTYTGGEIAGAVATPTGKVLQAPTMAARAKRAAVFGGAYGGISGAGAGETPEERATGAAFGVPIGAAAGAALTPVVETGVNMANRSLMRLGDKIRARRDPEAQAAVLASRAKAEDVKADPNAVGRLTEDEYAAAQAADIPVRNIDTMGDTGRALADVAAIQSPTAKGTLDRMIDPRFKGQGERVINWLENNVNYKNTAETEAARREVRTATNGPAYQRAYREGDRPIMNPELEQAQASPSVQAAIESAMRKWKDYAVVDGFGVMNPPFVIKDGVLTRTGGKGLPVEPNAQLWDYVSRELQDRAREAAPGSQAANLYNQLARKVKNGIDAEVPAMKQAREGALGFFQAEDAVTAGREFVDLARKNTEARIAFGKLTPEQRKLFTDGFITEYLAKLGAVSDRQNVLTRIGQSKEAREKLDLVLGPQKARELDTMLRVELIMDRPRDIVQGNSRTTARLVAAGIFGGAGVGELGHGGYNMNPGELATGAVLSAIGTALATGGKKVDARVANKIAELLTSDDPKRFNAGVQLIARSDKLYQNLKEFGDRKAAQAAGTSGPAALRNVLPATGAGRAGAEDENRQP